MYSMRCVPSRDHKATLHSFDAAVRRCFEDLTGIHADDNQWQQASRCFKEGGLGLRQTAAHAEAAYIASRLATRYSCPALSPQHTWEADTNGNGSGLYQAVAAYNTLVADADKLAESRTSVRQQDLSNAIDKASHLAWTPLTPEGGERCSQKPSPERLRSLTASARKEDAHGSQQSSSMNSGFALACQSTTTRHGAASATLCWIVSATTPAAVALEGSAPSDTTPPAILSTTLRRRRDTTQHWNSQAYSHPGWMTPLAPTAAADQLTSTLPRGGMDNQPLWTSPSPRQHKPACSGKQQRKPAAQPWHTRPRRGATSTLSSNANNRAWLSCRSSWRPGAALELRRTAPSKGSRSSEPPDLTQRAPCFCLDGCTSFAPQCDGPTPEQSSGGRRCKSLHLSCGRQPKPSLLQRSDRPPEED